MSENYPVSKNLIGRLSFYRRMLSRTLDDDPTRDFIFSHELASTTGYTAALVRRDIMTIGFSGNPRKGYSMRELVESIGRFLDAPEPTRAALAGVGNLGRALLAYFSRPQSRVPIVAAFDIDRHVVGSAFMVCPCYDASRIGEVVAAESIRTAILAVPPSAAQELADRFVEAGIRGILNFAPVFIDAPEPVYVSNIDMTMSLEQVAYYSR